MLKLNTIRTNDCLAIACNGTLLDFDLTDVNELMLSYENGVFHIIIDDKEEYVLQKPQTENVIPEEQTQENIPNNRRFIPRTFKGRLPGRFKEIQKHFLDAALHEYDEALAIKKGKGKLILPKWAMRFNVKTNTVRNWMSKHRTFRKHTPSTFGDLLKAATVN